MSRPKSRCCISCKPECKCLQPIGRLFKRKKTDAVELFLEEMEAIRLKDLEGLSQTQCAAKMKVSQPTFHRLLAQARNKVADAVINGKSLVLHSDSN